MLKDPMLLWSLLYPHY